MKKVFNVFFRDLKTIRNNIAALIIITGLCILPSLYAWINIKACWDPYSNTANLPVAIVNSDEGTVFNGKIINVGNSVEDQLKKNKSIGWVFVDEWQGNYGLNEGKYYALIEIPHNFSSGLVSLSTTSPQKPYIVYRVNAKLNAIAAKITNVAKEKLVDSIKSNFVSTVNKQAIVTLKNDAQKTNLNRSQISEIKTIFTEADTNISALKNNIDKANSDSLSLDKYLNTVNATLPKLTEEINNLENVSEISKSLTLTTKQTIEKVSTDLNNDIISMQTLNEENKNLLSKLKAANNNTLDADSINIMKETINICDSLHVILSSDIENLNNLNKNYNSSSISYLITSLNAVDKEVSIEKAKLTELIPLITEGSSKEQVNSAIDTLTSLSDEVSKSAQELSNSFYTKGSPALSDLTNNLSIKLDDTKDILELTKAIIPELNSITSYGSAGSKLSVGEANKLSSKLSAIQTDINKLDDKISSITNENLNSILDIVQNHPSEIANFISNPIDVKNIEVYDAGLFGVGLTPFYTTLAIWVGSLLLCALLSVECEEGEQLNLKQKHFGKMLLFIFLSLIQSTIITLGDVYILGVRPESMALMMLFSFLSSITFTVIIFTLVSIFGNVGKAIAVVIMVFQIAGAGGIYPIQTNPKIFGIMQPLWPFTYAINGFREAIAGPIWSSVLINVYALLLFLLVFLLLAILKKPFHKLTEFLEHKYKEAEL